MADQILGMAMKYAVWLAIWPINFLAHIMHCKSIKGGLMANHLVAWIT